MGKGGLLTSLVLRIFDNPRFVGFNWKHVEQPYLKSIFEEAWALEEDMLNKSCTRFREEVTLNSYFFRYWQFASNRFSPVRLNHTCKLRTVKEDMPRILEAIMNPQIKSLCINDTTVCTDEEYVHFKEDIHQVFCKKFPHKSSFEK